MNWPRGIACLLLSSLACSQAPVQHGLGSASRHLHSYASWDSSGAAVIEILLNVADEVLGSYGDPMLPRVVLTATLRNRNGDRLQGNAWTFPIHPGHDLQVRRRFRVDLQNESQDLEATFLVRGESIEPAYRRPFRFADTAIQVQEPQLWPETEEIPSVSRFVASDVDSLRWVSGLFWNPATTASKSSGLTQQVHIRVQDGTEVPLVDKKLEITAISGFRTFEFHTSRPEPGSYRLELVSSEGHLLASQWFSIGMGDFDLPVLGEDALIFVRLVFPSFPLDEFKKADAEERQAIWERIWQEADPDPSTAVNEFRQIVDRRLRQANELFGAGEGGWKSDRGRAYLRWGAPDEIENLGKTEQLEHLERWTYYGSNVVLIFISKYGDGRYTLYRSNVAMD